MPTTLRRQSGRSIRIAAPVPQLYFKRHQKFLKQGQSICVVMVAPHSGSLGPVAEFAAVHLLSALPNGLILERLVPDWAGRANTIHGELPGVAGLVQVPQGNGLGVSLNLEFINQHPSERNTAIATGGWNPGTESETVLTQFKRPRATQFPLPHTDLKDPSP